MIKLNLNIESTNSKVIVDYVFDHQPTVISFLKRVVDICGLTQVAAQDLQLFDEDFILPHQLPSRCISENKIYTVSLAHHLKKNIIQNKKKQKFSKANANNQKSKHFKRKSSSSSSSQSSSNIESQIQSNQSDNKNKPIQRKIVKAKQIIGNNSIKKTQNKVKDTKLKLRQQISSSEQEQKPKKLIARKKQQSSEQSSLSQSSTPLPQLRKNNLKPRKQAQQKQINWRENKSVIYHNHNQNQKNKNIKQNQQKKLVSNQGSSQQQQQNEVKKYADKVKQILSRVKNPQPKIAIKIKQPIHNTTNFTNTKNQSEIKNNSVINKPKIIPNSVKAKTNINQNKTTQNTNNLKQANEISGSNKNEQTNELNLSFKQHQQMKWIPITKDVLKDWMSAFPQLPVVQQKNQIRFKIIQLDELKFIPVSSGWISGFVSTVQKKGTSLIIMMENATKQALDETEKSQFFKSYEVPMHNMQQLQINKNTLKDQQKTIIKSKQEKIERTNIQSQPKVPQKTETKQTSTIVQDKQKPVQSLQQFICGQIHYYFGDKNYPTDLFMQMHANKDANKFIQIKLMLNFGKIKKVLNDQNKLWHFLTTDDKYPFRSYELDFQRRMIKKKGI